MAVAMAGVMQGVTLLLLGALMASEPNHRESEPELVPVS